MDEMKTQFSETVTELQDLNDKLQQSQARKIKSLDNEFNETQGKLRKETDCVATLTSAIDRARYETFNVTLSWCSLSWLLFSDARLHKHIATLKRRSRVRRTI